MKKLRLLLSMISTMLNIATSIIVLKKLKEGDFIVQSDKKQDKP